jgi:hypothetical protein
MTFSEVLRRLRAEGLPVTGGQIRYAVVTRRIARPPQDGAGNHRFSNRHLAQLRSYLSVPRRRGRKATTAR